MKVCYTGGAVTDHGSYYAVATNAVELRIWFLTDDILRIRDLLRGKVASASGETRMHYQYLLHNLDKALNK